MIQISGKVQGKFLGRENKQILVKHGRVYIRVHACRLQHAQNSQMTSTKENIESENRGNVESKNEPLDIYGVVIWKLIMKLIK